MKAVEEEAVVGMELSGSGTGRQLAVRQWDSEGVDSETLRQTVEKRKRKAMKQ